MSSIPEGHHIAAIVKEKGAPHELLPRKTPTPGPNELLIDVRAVALNPLDNFQRDAGGFVSEWPTILGTDVSGIVVETGSDVDPTMFKDGTRVSAYSLHVYTHNIDNSAFQSRVLVPFDEAVPIPDSISFVDGSILPMSVATAWSGYTTIGMTFDTIAVGRKGILVWGGSSSMGSSAVQIAKSMGFIVYATASAKHHEYVKTLGASKVFDYKNGDVVEQIIQTAKDDNLTFEAVYDAVPGALKECISVLKEIKGEGSAKVASAPVVPPDFPKTEGVDVMFVMPPMEPAKRSAHYRSIFNVWLKNKLASGEFVPSPKAEVVPGGLAALDSALAILKEGVSGTKIVVEV